MSAEDAARPMVTADPVLAKVLDRLAQVNLEHYGGGRMGVTARCYREVVNALPNGVPTIQQVAKALATSVRTLQRALAEEKCSFRGLIEQARREEALVLERAGLAEEEIAQRLGYAEPASYRRARARWPRHEGA